MSWEHFDKHIKDQFNAYNPAVPESAWQKIAQARGFKKPAKSIIPFDNYVAEQFNNYTPDVPDQVWTEVYDVRFDQFVSTQLGNYSPAVSADVWKRIAAERKDKKRPAFWYWAPRAAAVLLLLLSAIQVYRWFNKENISPAMNSKTVENTTLTNQPDINNTVIPDNSEVPLPAIESSVYSPLKGVPLSGNITIAGTEPPMLDPIFSDPTLKVNTGTPLAESTPNRNYYLLTLMAERANPFSLRPNRFGKLRMPDCPVNPGDRLGGNFWEIYAGPDYAFNNISDLDGNAAYILKRKQATKFSHAFSAGVRYTKLFNNGASFRVGLNYSQINDKLTVSTGGIIQVVYLLNSLGDTIGSYTVNGTRYQKINNNHRSIDIPVQMGYELDASERFNVNISAGAAVNIRSWQKGSTIDTSGNVVSITTGKAQPEYQYKTNTGVSLLASGTLYYKLKDEKTALFAEPYFRYNISSMNDMKHTSVKQKYNTAGVRLGVRVKF